MLHFIFIWSLTSLDFGSKVSVLSVRFKADFFHDCSICLWPTQSWRLSGFLWSSSAWVLLLLGATFWCFQVSTATGWTPGPSRMSWWGGTILSPFWCLMRRHLSSTTTAVMLPNSTSWCTRCQKNDELLTLTHNLIIVDVKHLFFKWI